MDYLHEKLKDSIVSRLRSTASRSVDGMLIFRPLARDYGLDLETYQQLLAELCVEQRITIAANGDLTAVLTPQEQAIISRDLRINELERQLAAATNQPAPAASHIYANGAVTDAAGKVWYKLENEPIGWLLASYMHSIAELSAALLRFNAENEALKAEIARLTNGEPTT